MIRQPVRNTFECFSTNNFKFFKWYKVNVSNCFTFSKLLWKPRIRDYLRCSCLFPKKKTFSVSYDRMLTCNLIWLLFWLSEYFPLFLSCCKKCSTHSGVFPLNTKKLIWVSFFPLCPNVSFFRTFEPTFNLIFPFFLFFTSFGIVGIAAKLALFHIVANYFLTFLCKNCLFVSYFPSVIVVNLQIKN